MIKAVLKLCDPFVGSLILTVGAASIFPPRGIFVPIFGAAASFAIFALFFLHGAKLSREAIWQGFRNWRLHLAVLAATFVLFPLLGVGLAAIPFGDPALSRGILFLTLLPSTVQSSIAFTAIAGGDVAAAVCSASFSNLLGIGVTPVLVAILLSPASGAGGGSSLAAIWAIASQLLLPFAAGQILRPWIGPALARHKPVLTLVDRGSILLVVFSAFGAAVVAGIWHRITAPDLILLLMLCLVLLGCVLTLTWIAGQWFRFTRREAIVLQFCGSKKSLATGVPMAGILFPATQAGLVILPLMLFHQVQLIACAVLARHYADRYGQPQPEIRPPLKDRQD